MPTRRRRSGRTTKPHAELVAKWPEIVAQLKAELLAEPPPSSRRILAGMLTATRRRARLPGLGPNQQAKITALSRFVRLVQQHMQPVRRYDRRHHGARGASRHEVWLDGVHSTLLLFDILLLSERNDGLTDKAIAALLGREAGNREGGITRAQNHPGQFSRKQRRRLQEMADNIRAEDSALTAAEVLRRVAEAVDHPDPATFARKKLRHVIKIPSR